MLKKLFRKRSIEQQPIIGVPEGQCVYAIGDVHGRLDLLDDLLERIHDDFAGRRTDRQRIIFLGDLIDRGPDSAAVVDRAIELSRSDKQVEILMGNHEEVFLGALDGSTRMMNLFCKIGGKNTILSYGITLEEYNAGDYGDLIALCQARVPAAHIDFMRRFETKPIVVGDYVFVHAGVRPSVALGDQRESDMRWIRDEFLDSDVAHEKIVVHGHSITAEVDERDNRIGIDTGAFSSGKLTALVLAGTERRFLSTAGETMDA